MGSQVLSRCAGWLERRGVIGRQWLWLLGALGVALALVFWLGPYALSAYHLEVGGRALDAALDPVFPDRLAPEQIVDGERLRAGKAHLERSIRWDPRNVQAMRLLARVYLSRGEAEAALEVLRRASTVRPESLILRLELGDAYDSLGRTEEAVEAYEMGRVGSRGEVLAANYLKLAEAQAAWGSGDYAIELWRRALEVDPGNLHALYRLAEMHRDLGDEGRAAAYEERLRALTPEDVGVPLDFRLAEYQGRAMAGLVDAGIWEREKVLDVVAYQVERFGEGLEGLMTERVLETLLELWPEDPELKFYSLGENAPECSG